MKAIRFIGDNESSFSMNDDEEIVQISEHWYWHFYECVPPIGYTPCFLVGEPYDHDEEGYARYTLVFSVNGRYYAGQPMRKSAAIKAKMYELIEKYGIMSAILKDVLTMQEFRKLMDDDKWVKDFANAIWSCDKYGKHKYMKTVSYPIEYKVSEQQKRWAQTIRERRKREELERIKPGELVFVAMGMDYDAADPDEVMNHRMRTEFITDHGIKVFVEFTKGFRGNFWCDFSIHRTREEQMKHQDRVLGEQAKVYREHGANALCMEMYRRMGEQNYYNYMGVEKTDIDKPYTWTNVLEFVNRTYGTHFTSVRMDRYFLTTDDFVCRESADWKRRVKVNYDADLAMIDKPLRIFCMGGDPHIALCTYKTAHRGDSGYDYASIAHIIDGKPQWLDDADLLTDRQRKEVMEMCKRYTK